MTRTKRGSVGARATAITVGVFLAGSAFAGIAHAQEPTLPTPTVPTSAPTVPTSAPTVPTSSPSLPIPTTLPFSTTFPTFPSSSSTARSSSGGGVMTVYAPPQYYDQGNRYYPYRYYSSPYSTRATQTKSVPRGGVATGDGSYPTN